MTLYFPHSEIRESQKSMIKVIEKVIESKEHLLTHAPTGIGKTAASLSPTLSYLLKNEKKNTLFFITPMHTQHKIAIDTLKEIKEKYKLNFSVIDLIGKKGMCGFAEVETLSGADFYEFCKDKVKNRNCDYYNNVKKGLKFTTDAQIAITSIRNQILHVEDSKEKSVSCKVCPYEISLAAGKKSQVIICDYNQILNPAIRDTILNKLGKNLNECIIIIDESHNLPDKCRDLLSNKMNTFIIDLAAKEAKSYGYDEVSINILKIKDAFEELSRNQIEFEQEEDLITKTNLIKELDKRDIDIDEFAAHLIHIAEEIKEVKRKSFINSLAGFLDAWPGSDHGYTRIIKKGFNRSGKAIVTINYKCLDPSLLLAPLAKGTHSLICMSGTLTPMEMYEDLFGFPVNTLELKNDFPQQNKLNLIVPDTSTKYTARSKEMYQKIAAHVANVVNLVPGNTIVFFPSYLLRNEIYTYLETACEKTIFLEVPNMQKIDKTNLINRFKDYKDSGAVILAASSGSLGEGIDLRGDFLKAVMVVGLPLAKPDLETKELMEYYQFKFNKGWEYGYTLPAIIRILQNAGRCIRSKDDRGVVVFLDERYTWDNYFKCFPKDENLRITKDPTKRINEFFN